MVEWIGLSYGNRIRAYYLKQGKVFFIHQRFMSFQQTRTGLNLSKVRLTFEGRYYIHNDKLIKRITSGEIPMDDDSINNLNDLLSIKDEIRALNNKK